MNFNCFVIVLVFNWGMSSTGLTSDVSFYVVFFDIIYYFVVVVILM